MISKGIISTTYVRRTFRSDILFSPGMRSLWLFCLIDGHVGWDDGLAS